jgi:hypothetical protein
MGIMGSMPREITEVGLSLERRYKVLQILSTFITMVLKHITIASTVLNVTVKCVAVRLHISRRSWGSY